MSKENIKKLVYPIAHSWDEYIDKEHEDVKTYKDIEQDFNNLPLQYLCDIVDSLNDPIELSYFTNLNEFYCKTIFDFCNLYIKDPYLNIWVLKNVEPIE